MITKSIILNAWENNKQKVLAVQGEVGARWLDITLLDEKIPLDLTNCFVVIYMDTGVVIYNTCEITDALNGQISVELTQNMSGIYGDFEAEIHIYDELGNLLKIKGLEITIIKSTDITVTVEARDEFTALQQALATVGEYSGRIDTNVTDILTNAENIAENREDIDENRMDINTNTANIQTLNTNKADKTELEEKANIEDIANGDITINATDIQGLPISTTEPTENQMLKLINGVWTPKDSTKVVCGSGTFTSTSVTGTNIVSIDLGFSCTAYLCITTNYEGNNTVGKIGSGSNVIAEGKYNNENYYWYIAIRE